VLWCLSVILYHVADNTVVLCGRRCCIALSSVLAFF